MNAKTNTDFLAGLRMEILGRGVASASDLASAMRVSQPTISRRLSEMDAGLVRIGQARDTVYALKREVDGESEWPVFVINEAGKANTAGILRAVGERQFLFEASAPHPVFGRPEFVRGLYPGLPWFFDDLRPQGFLGRAAARQYSWEIGAPPDPRLWMDEQVLKFALRHGGDLPGNLLIGERALAAWEGQKIRRATQSDYAGLARAAMAGETAGSSAGGEQPKFLCRRENGDGGVRDCLVKFSPPLSTAAGRRWADLLVAEKIAGEVLARYGIPTANSEWTEDGERAYLTVTRFDRTGARGRRGMVSLGAVDAALFGQLDTPWTAAADRLSGAGLLSRDDADSLRFLWWFGEAIGNTDRHYGNVSLLFSDDRQPGLAPAYDMLPMVFAPAVNGEIVERTFAPNLSPARRNEWQPAVLAARDFWSEVARSFGVSREFSSIARNARRVLEGGDHHKASSGANLLTEKKHGEAVSPRLDGGKRR